MPINNVEKRSFFSFEDEECEEVNEPRMFEFNPDDPTVDIYKPIVYKDKKYTFDRTNMPIFYRGVYWVFGKDLSSLYICKRDFVFPN